MATAEFLAAKTNEAFTPENEAAEPWQFLATRKGLSWEMTSDLCHH